MEGGGRGGTKTLVFRTNSPRLRALAKFTTFSLIVSAISAATISRVEPAGTMRVIESSMDSLNS